MGWVAGFFIVHDLSLFLRYDMIQHAILTCAHKPTRVRLIYRTETTTNKKLSYRRGTARCVVSIEILPIATQQSCCWHCWCPFATWPISCHMLMYWQIIIINWAWRKVTNWWLINSGERVVQHRRLIINEPCWENRCRWLVTSSTGERRQSHKWIWLTSKIYDWVQSFWTEYNNNNDRLTAFDPGQAG